MQAILDVLLNEEIHPRFGAAHSVDKRRIMARFCSSSVNVPLSGMAAMKIARDVEAKLTNEEVSDLRVLISGVRYLAAWETAELSGRPASDRRLALIKLILACDNAERDLFAGG